MGILTPGPPLRIGINYPTTGFHTENSFSLVESGYPSFFSPFGPWLNRDIISTMVASDDVGRLISCLDGFKNSGNDDGIRRRLWWFLFKPRHDCNFYRRIWRFKCKRVQSGLLHDNASCYLDYVREFNKSSLLNNNSSSSIKVFQYGEFFIGYIEYTEDYVSRAKAMYDLKLRSWCLIGIHPRMYNVAKNQLCHQKEVVTFEDKRKMDIGELTDVYNFVHAQVGMWGRLNLKWHLDVDGWLQQIRYKWVDNWNTVVYQQETLI